MFDEYKILEYLLNKAYKRVRISYRKIYEQFGVGADDNNDEIPYEDKRSVSNFLDAMEKAEKRIVRDVMNDEIVPIYSTILYKETDKLPGIGFYDVFRNRNRSEYINIAGNIDVQDAFKNQQVKKTIFQVGMEILKNDLDNRFPDEESINEFIQEVRMYRDI